MDLLLGEYTKSDSLRGNLESTKSHSSKEVNDSINKYKQTIKETEADFDR